MTKEREEEIHGTAWSQGEEFTMCGMAFDAFESGDADAPIVFAERGETVTCKDCRDAIDHVRKSFKRYRVIA